MADTTTTHRGLTVIGRPCGRCGGTERRAANRNCVSCARKDSRERMARVRANDPDHNKKQAEWRDRIPGRYQESNRARGLRRKFGLTTQQYDRMLEAQGGVCAICKRDDPSGRRLAVDHDHRTGRVRALLCMNCNNAIGRFGDDPDLCEAAALYLRGHNG